MSAPTPRSRPRVVDRHALTAEELLGTLSPMSDQWAREGSAWIYRGQGNADWELKARAMRENEAFKPFGIEGDSSHWSPRLPLLLEMLARFRQGLEETGLAIPARSPRVLSEEFNGTTFGADPPREAWPLMALAQHHGLPTPLLDWSKRASVAAYFAASSALDPRVRATTSHVAVWCLDTGKHVGRDDDFFRAKSGHLQIYVAPGGTNPNLRAQAGIFTYVLGEGDPSIEGYVADLDAKGIATPMLHRVTLPVTEAGKLLRLLSNDGINGASMFPGADGVVRAMREQAQWDRRPPSISRRKNLPA
jgi:hypothetical protein